MPILHKNISELSNSTQEKRQLWAKTDNNKIIEIHPKESEEIRKLYPNGLKCLDPNCTIPMRPRGGEQVTDHFYHVTQANHSGETIEHIMGKAMLLSWAKEKYPQYNSAEEVTLHIHSTNHEERKIRRPDVYINNPANNKHIALEVEYKKFDIDDWKKKEEDLKTRQCNTAWFFGLSKFKPTTVPQSQRDKIYEDIPNPIKVPPLMEKLIIEGYSKPLYIIDPWTQQIGLFSSNPRINQTKYTSENYGYSLYADALNIFSLDDLHFVPIEECFLTDNMKFSGPWDYSELKTEQQQRNFLNTTVTNHMKNK